MAGGRPILFRIIKHKISLWDVKSQLLCSVECKYCHITVYYLISCFHQLTCSGSRQRPAVKVCEKWDCAPPPMLAYTPLTLATCLNFPNLCDNFVKKLVSEIRKCHQLQGDFVP